MAKKSKQVIKEEETDAMETSQVEGKSDKSSYDELMNHVSIIAKPMASRKLTKRIYKLLKKGSLIFLLYFYSGSSNIYLASSCPTQGICEKRSQGCTEKNSTW